MFKVIKKQGKIQKAYRLGENSPVLVRLMEEGKIKISGDGKYEIFSQEVLKSGSVHGEQASAGDYVKLDSTGAPYPNEAAFFEKNHRHISGDDYEQIPVPLLAWSEKEPVCEEIRYLIQNKGLILNPEDPEHYYTAPLWGTVEAADIHAVLIFYSILYGKQGEIEDISYNLVERSEFEKNYRRVE